MLNKGQEFECVIEKLGFGGEGIVKIDDFVIFIKGTIPGQKIKAVLTKKKKNHAEARLLEILKDAPQAIQAKCKHFGVCGGCKWQNLSYKDQLSYKEQQVLECLEHIGNFSATDFKLDSIVGSPKEYEYRNKVEFSFGYSNMWIDKTDPDNWIYHDEDPTLGFHAPNKWEQVVDIEYCHLVSEKVNQVFTIVKEWCLTQGKDVYNPKIHKGFWRQLLVRENLQGDILINLIVSGQDNCNYDELIEKLRNFVQSFYLTIHDGVNDNWTTGDIQCLFGKEEIQEEIMGMKFTISPESFFQTNSLGAEELYGKVREYAQKTDTTILDLYCGTGTIGQILAGDNKDAHIVGLELLESAVADAYKNAKLNQLNNVEYFAGPAEKTLPNVLEKYQHFDMVIIDPPRAGMHKKAIETLLTIEPKHIVYVSCNPATLARDLRILCDEGGYTLQRVCPVDMFPHTAHIEVVTQLTKK